MGSEAWTGSTVVAGRWQEAEARLYAGLVAAPDLLERAVEFVGRVANQLRDRAADLASLFQLAEARDALLAEVGNGPPEALSLETLIDAACAIRYRELRAEEARANLRNAFRHAAEQGVTWMNFPESSGTPLHGTAPGLPTGLGDRLAVHVPSGLCVVTAVEQDPETGEAVFVGRAASVDAATGGLGPPPEGLRAQWSETTPQGHERQVADLRQRIGSTTAAVSDSE